MVLTIGAGALLIFFLGMGLAMRISDNARLPAWIRDGFIVNVYLPLLIAVLGMGLGYVVYYLYQLVYGYASLWTLDTLSGALLLAALGAALCWAPAKRAITGRSNIDSPANEQPEAMIIPLPAASSVEQQDELRRVA